ncbi:MAG: topoisomerase DNA-binding C4 zinc finger domain-containing protein [Spartobacteria bacterium]
MCSKPMRRRKSAKGEFWGCSSYPDCKGSRPS